MIKLEMPSLRDQTNRDLKENLKLVEGLREAIKEEIKKRDPKNGPVFFMDL